MKGYIISVIGAALLASAASMLAPEKWSKYINIITGLVVICTIISPVAKISPEDIFSSFTSEPELVQEGEELRQTLIEEELEKRINEDIEQRLEQEFNIKCRAQCKISADAEGKIERVEKITIYDAELPPKAAARLCEVYGIDKIENE